MRIPSGVVDQYVYFVGVDETDLNARETGLSSFTVYRSRNGGAAAAMTTPTVNETDSSNMPGVYELLLDEDTTIAAGNDSEEMALHISHAGMAPVTRVIELYRPKITAGYTLGVESDGDLTKVNTLDGHTAQTADHTAGIADVPTVSEFNARSLPSADYVVTSDTIAGVTLVDTCTTNSDMRGTDGANTTVPDAAGTAATPAEVATALTDIKLDHLVAVAEADDPVDDSIIAKLASSDGDWSGFNYTADSLEAIRDRGDADWSSGAAANPNMLLEAEIAVVNSQTEFTLASGSDKDDAYNDQSIVLYDDSNSDYPNTRVITDYVGATKTVTIDSATTDWTLGTDDSVKVFVTAPGSSAPTAAQNADAVWDEAIADHTGAGSFGAKNQKVVPSETINDYKATGFSTHSAADVVDNWETQSQADPTGFHVNVMELNGTAQTTGADIKDILDDVTGLNGDAMRGTDGANTTVPDAAGVAPTADEVALAILKYDWDGITGEAARSVLNALRFLRNKWTSSGGTLTVTKENDTDAAWTAALSSDASADPITGSDPA